MESTRAKPREAARRRARALLRTQLVAMSRIEAAVFVDHSERRYVAFQEPASDRECLRGERGHGPSSRGDVVKRRSPETIAREHCADVSESVIELLFERGRTRRFVVPVPNAKRDIRRAISAAIRADRKQRKGAKRK